MLKLQTDISRIIPYSQSTTVLSNVPFGVYRVLAYDIESEGHLMMPTAIPATINSVVVLGTLPVGNDHTNDLRTKQINTILDVSLHFLTLTVNCEFPEEYLGDSCVVLLSSEANPSILTVKVQQRKSSKPLVYSIELKTNYTITVFTLNHYGITNSTVSSKAVFIGKFT